MERSMVNSASDLTSGSSRNTRRSCSTLCTDQCDKFASVRLRVVPPSRQLSRSRIAAGERRLGTVSMNMDADGTTSRPTVQAPNRPNPTPVRTYMDTAGDVPTRDESPKRCAVNEFATELGSEWK